MARHTPLRRELPNLRQDGSIKFRIVLRQARNEKQILADLIAKRRIAGYANPAAFIRTVMKPLREKIAHDRASWSVANEPTSTVEMQRVEHFGCVWIEQVATGPIANPCEAA